ncbi:ion channel [Streptomyces sp. NPDC090077]|uniref:ion channel n=1 Tax=Streptomyces sp. NPDC090077 TaxID=3365938 RepID=UPI00382AFCE5
MDATGSAQDDYPPEGPTSPAGRPRRRVRPALVVTIRCLATVAAVLVAYCLLPFTGKQGDITALVLGLSAVAVIFAVQIRSIALSDHPRLRGVEVLATTIPLFLLLYATTYYLLEASGPGSFSAPLTRTDALYFTLTVFSTVGIEYGQGHLVDVEVVGVIVGVVLPDLARSGRHDLVDAVHRDVAPVDLLVAVQPEPAHLGVRGDLDRGGRSQPGRGTSRSA